MSAEIADSVLARWADAFERRSVEELVALYSSRALFYGSTPPLLKGREGVRSYFNALPPMDALKIRFVDVAAEPFGDDTIHVASVCRTTVGGKKLAGVRMTHSLVREMGAWRIACHHASPLNANYGLPG